MQNTNDLKLAGAKGMLIFAGNLIPYDNIGSSCQFSVLEYPNELEKIQARIVESLKIEKQLLHELQESLCEEIDALRLNGDAECIARGRGVRIWFLANQKKVDHFHKLSNHAYGSRQLKNALKIIDTETEKPPIAIYKAKEEISDFDQTKNVSRFVESLIIECENFYLANL